MATEQSTNIMDATSSADEGKEMTFADFLQIEKEACAKKETTTLLPSDIAHVIMQAPEKELTSRGIITGLEKWYEKVFESPPDAEYLDKRMHHFDNMCFAAIHRGGMLWWTLRGSARERYERYACLEPELQDFRQKYARFVDKDTQIKMIVGPDTRNNRFNFVDMYFTYCIIQIIRANGEGNGGRMEKNAIRLQLEKHNPAFENAPDKEDLLESVLKNCHCFLCNKREVLLKHDYQQIEAMEEFLKLYSLSAAVLMFSL